MRRTETRAHSPAPHAHRTEEGDHAGPSDARRANADVFKEHTNGRYRAQFP